MNRRSEYWQIAVPTPLRKLFDYLPPQDTAPVPGIRVQAPFGARKLVAVVLGASDVTDVPASRLKAVAAVLDQEPVFNTELLALLKWAAEYYHFPIGEVCQTALPVLLRRGLPQRAPGISKWSLTSSGQAMALSELKRAPVQLRLLQALKQHHDGLDGRELGQHSSNWRSVIRAMIKKGWVQQVEGPCLANSRTEPMASPVRNTDQEQAVAAIVAELGHYRSFLLHGVTGSGKTEVYLAVIEAALQQGRQVLVLVPEIGLTPQLVQRFRSRLAVPVAVQHSGLTDAERHCAWWMAHSGEARVLIGTRSAVFASMPQLGLVIIDEEHDGSYKQQDGFRYHARDVAIMRASRLAVPVLLGSATPSLETLYRVQQGQYHRLALSERAGAAQMPHIETVDLRKMKPSEGLSPALVEAINKRLQRGEQSLLFLNRRGYAPVLMCHQCGWLADCGRCDARLTLHSKHNSVWCHHCGYQAPIPQACPECDGIDLHPIGEGTERIEQSLAKFFPKANIVRMDRDSTRRKGSMEKILKSVHSGEADILVGTQMLAKGHDFANVTLVGVINADQGLYSIDFRASEKMFQQLLQVCGRAGRADKPGQVLIQTYHPDDPLFAALKTHDYQKFADYILQEREQTVFPPYAHLALLRAEAPAETAALDFVRSAHDSAQHYVNHDVRVLDPLPSPMPRRAGRYRAQLMVQSRERKPLHIFIKQWLGVLEGSKDSKKVRWSLDIDPMDLY